MPPTVICSAASLWLVWLSALLHSHALAAEKVEISDPIEFHGMCDASAVVALSENVFAVASDEDSVLRIYNHAERGHPAAVLDLGAFLDLDPRKPETDIEAAARVGDMVYWISSHGKNKFGKERSARHRFFATKIVEKAGIPTLQVFGRPCATLLDQLLASPSLARYGLIQASLLTPKSEGGLNIEGLCAAPDGSLLIGFRNPIPKGRALVVPLLNPSRVIQGESAIFGPSKDLDLEGLGIRDMVYDDETKKYYIIGGSYDGVHDSHLFRWNGHADPKVIERHRFKHLNPEAILINPLSRTVDLISDDGKRIIGGFPCKDLNDPAQRSFRLVRITF